MHIASAFVVALLALGTAAQGSAQRADSAKADPGFTIEVPPGFPPIQKMDVGAGEDDAGAGSAPEITLFRSSLRTKETVLVVRAANLQVSLPDTSLAMLRLFLSSASVGVLSSRGTEAESPVEEIVRPDRLIFRRRTRHVTARGDTAFALSDITVQRGGPTVLWAVEFVARTRQGATTLRAHRVLDSFHITANPRLAFFRDATPVFQWVNGRWNWMSAKDPCGPGSFTLALSPDSSRIVLTYDRPAGKDTVSTYTYDVLWHGISFVRGRIQGETRKDAAGQPVVWDFMRMNHDAFCWHQVEWAVGHCTPPVERCTATAAGSSGPRPLAVLPRDPSATDGEGSTALAGRRK